MKPKYVFLDRDGVINKDPGGWTKYNYVTRWKDFYFLPNVLRGLKKLKNAGYKTIIISNQQGVGKKFFTEEQLKKVTKRMMAMVEKSGGKIDDVYYCMHRSEENCRCRKPKKGLFLMAKKEFKIKTIKDSFFIGDTKRDIEAGRRAGLNTILVLSGKSKRKDVAMWENEPDYICKDLLEAVRIVLAAEGRDT